MGRYFTEDFRHFFEELSSNNNKEWFDANKKRYENSVKKPFYILVEDLITCLREQQPEFRAEAKDCIFRINRDVRFSADKTPYKTQASALITPLGRKDMHNPGLYIELTHEYAAVYGGIYMPDKDMLQDIRWHIIQNKNSFKKAYSEPNFVAAYGNILGEKNKRLPAEMMEDAADEPLLFNKQFYYCAKLPADVLTRENLKEEILRLYEAAAGMNAFFRSAIA